MGRGAGLIAAFGKGDMGEFVKEGVGAAIAVGFGLCFKYFPWN